jgi:acylpyruvate hydrolase
MRIVSFRSPGGDSFGVRLPEGVLDLSQSGGGNGLIDFIQLAPAMMAARVREALSAETRLRPFESLDLLPVIPRPGKFLCLGLNYIDHAREGGHLELPPYPTLFMRAATSLLASGKPIVRPILSETLDYEAELAAVLGKMGKNITEEAALAHVAGYALFNDATIRAYQRATSQWTPGKNFDGTGAFGPELVTPDELPNGAVGLRIRSRLNGIVMQDSDTADMMFGVARTISLLSRIMTFEPGDVIAMGTPAGVGHARKPPVWMRNGDVCEIEIEGIGILRNPIVDEVECRSTTKTLQRGAR